MSEDKKNKSLFFNASTLEVGGAYCSCRRNISGKFSFDEIPVIPLVNQCLPCAWGKPESDNKKEYEGS